MNAVTFLISASLVLSVHLPSPRLLERDSRGWSNVTFGARAYLATPRLRGLLALSFVVAAAGAMVIVNTVVYVRENLGGTQSETAFAFAAYGAGSMIVALTLPRFLDRFPDRPLMLGGSVLLALGLFLGLSEPDFHFLLIIWMILGMGGSLIQTPAGRLIKRSAHDADRPSIFAFQFALSHACWLITYPLAGWIGGTLSMMAAFLVFGMLSVIATGMALILWPADEPMELEHSHGSMRHDHRHIHDEHHQHSHQGWEEQEPHHHPHTHSPMKHTHAYVIDLHHPDWPIAY